MDCVDFDKLENLSFEELETIPIFKIFSILHRTHFVYINHNLKEFDISSGQFPYLMFLYTKGDLTQDQLVKFFNVTDGVVTRALDKLEKNSLIIRTPDSNNKRRNIISLTDKGEKLAKKIENLEDLWENEVYSFLDKEEFEDIKYKLHLASINAIKLNK